jgi:glycosyltransferase involved in cell wall biosynthesis
VVAVDSMGPRTAFLFTGSRRERLKEEEFPSEFFYGSLELQRAGYPIEFLQEADFGLDRPLARLPQLAGWAALAVAQVNPLRLARLAHPKALARLNRFEVILVSANNLALELAALKALRLLRPRVVAILMGAIPLEAGPAAVWRIRQYLKQLQLVVLSRSEQLDQQRRVGASIRIGYLPFGVDHEFWKPAAREEPGDYALCVGNTHRDFELLARAWQPEFTPLKIVTICKVPPSRGRIEVIRGHWQSRILSDVGIRDLTQRARFVVVPLVQTVHPAGQSATLQAMACGKPVILTRSRGIWDDSVLVHGKTCLLINPGRVPELRAAAASLSADGGLCRAIGARAREVVTAAYTSQHMAEALAGILKNSISRN